VGLLDSLGKGSDNASELIGSLRKGNAYHDPDFTVRTHGHGQSGQWTVRATTSLSFFLRVLSNILLKLLCHRCAICGVRPITEQVAVRMLSPWNEGGASTAPFVLVDENTTFEFEARLLISVQAPTSTFRKNHTCRQCFIYLLEMPLA
jgi:hypothetical protein